MNHFCIDPQDPYAQDEVLVTFQESASQFRLLSAINGAGEDVLDELLEIQREDLLLELSQAVRPVTAHPSFRDRWGTHSKAAI